MAARWPLGPEPMTRRSRSMRLVSPTCAHLGARQALLHRWSLDDRGATLLRRVTSRQQRLVEKQEELLVVIVAVAVLGREAGDWRPIELFASLFAHAVAGEFVSVRTGRVHIGPAFLAAALA